MQRIQSFQEFWPYYLGEHSRQLTRVLHYIGSTLALLTLVAAPLTGRYWLWALMPVFGYAFAWIGHFFVEKNRPATFTYPLWSLRADCVMYSKWLSGQLAPDLERLDSVADRPLAHVHAASEGDGA